MDKQQGATVQHRELYSISLEKKMKNKVYIYIYIVNIVNQLYFNNFLLKEGKFWNNKKNESQG